MLWCSQSTLRLVVLVVCLAKVGKEVFPVELAIKLVHLGDLMSKLLHEALGEASHDIHLAYASLFLCLAEFKNHVDAFFLCVGYESASVDYNYFALRMLAVMGDCVAIEFELPYQSLRIYKIL